MNKATVLGCYCEVQHCSMWCVSVAYIQGALQPSNLPRNVLKLKGLTTKCQISSMNVVGNLLPFPACMLKLHHQQLVVISNDKLRVLSHLRSTKCLNILAQCFGFTACNLSVWSYFTGLISIFSGRDFKSVQCIIICTRANGDILLWVSLV